MADYIGTMRSNEYTFDSPEAKERFFREAEELNIIDFGELVFAWQDEDRLTAIIYGYCGIPYGRFVGEEEDFEEFDFPEFLSKFMRKGTKTRITEIGYEKMRYLNAVAFDIERGKDPIITNASVC